MNLVMYTDLAMLFRLPIQIQDNLTMLQKPQVHRL